MKKIYIVLNSFLVILIILAIFIVPTKGKYSINLSSKSLTTNIFNQAQLRTVSENKVEEQVVPEEIPKEEEPVATEPVSNVVSNNNVALDNVVTDTLETQVGSLSAYGPDCVGCSGRLAGGFDARGGNYYYYDEAYGNIRIVAADRQYPFGTIVRVSGTSLGDFNAIVLDRGGGIGFGKKFLFDLLCSSQNEARGVGSFYNVTFQVLRYGY